MSTSRKETCLETLGRLLGDAFLLHGKGASGTRLGRAYGVADGYMLALMDAGIATRTELGTVVAMARARQLDGSVSTRTNAAAEMVVSDSVSSALGTPPREGTRAA
jgi:hypothetical protein